MRNRYKSLKPEELTPQKARVLALKYLSIRPRTYKELLSYLQEKGFMSELAHVIVREMVSYGYVNDEQFAANFVGWKQERGWGPNKIAHALRAKGIETDLIQVAVDKQGQDYYEQCYKVATKKVSSSSRNITKQSLLRFLLGRGFTPKMAQMVVQELYSALDGPNLDIPSNIY